MNNVDKHRVLSNTFFMVVFSIHSPERKQEAAAEGRVAAPAGGGGGGAGDSGSESAPAADDDCGSSTASSGFGSLTKRRPHGRSSLASADDFTRLNVILIARASTRRGRARAAAVVAAVVRAALAGVGRPAAALARRPSR